MVSIFLLTVAESSSGPIQFLIRDWTKMLKSLGVQSDTVIPPDPHLLAVPIAHFQPVTTDRVSLILEVVNPRSQAVYP